MPERRCIVRCYANELESTELPALLADDAVPGSRSARVLLSHVIAVQTGGGLLQNTVVCQVRHADKSEPDKSGPDKSASGRAGDKAELKQDGWQRKSDLVVVRAERRSTAGQAGQSRSQMSTLPNLADLCD